MKVDQFHDSSARSGRVPINLAVPESVEIHPAVTENLHRKRHVHAVQAGEPGSVPAEDRPEVSLGGCVQEHPL